MSTSSPVSTHSSSSLFPQEQQVTKLSRTEDEVKKQEEEIKEQKKEIENQKMKINQLELEIKEKKEKGQDVSDDNQRLNLMMQLQLENKQRLTNLEERLFKLQDEKKESEEEEESYISCMSGKGKHERKGKRKAPASPAQIPAAENEELTGTSDRLEKGEESKEEEKKGVKGKLGNKLEKQKRLEEHKARLEEKENDRLLKVQEDKKKELSEEKNKLIERLKELREVREEEKKRLYELKEEKNKLYEEKNRLYERLKVSEEEKNRLMKVREEEKNRLKILEEQKKVLKEEKKKASCDDEKKRIDEQITQVNEEKKSIDEEKKRIDELVTQANEEKKRIDELVTQANEEKKRIDDQITRIDELVTQANEEKKRIDDKITRIDEKKRIDDQIIGIDEEEKRNDEQITRIYEQVMTLVSGKTIGGSYNVQQLSSQLPAKKARIDVQLPTTSLASDVVREPGYELKVPLPQGRRTLDPLETNTFPYPVQQVVVYGDREMQSKLLDVKASTLTWREVYLYLFSALNQPLTSTATLLTTTVAYKEECRIFLFEIFDVSTEDTTLTSGEYVLLSSSSSLEFCLSTEFDPCSRATSVNSSVSDEVEVFRQKRTQAFHNAVVNRDNYRCVISKSGVCQACHVLPINCANDSSLPLRIRDLLKKIPNGTNSVRNGITLSNDLHVLFDRYLIGMKYFGHSCYVLFFDHSDDNILISTYKQYHLKRLDVNWSVSTGPLQEFLDYHCNVCLAKCFRAAADVKDYFFDSDNDEEKIMCNTSAISATPDNGDDFDFDSDEEMGCVDSNNVEEEDEVNTEETLTLGCSQQGLCAQSIALLGH